jgi:hypothetical protein
MWFPQSSLQMDWSTCGWNGGAPPLSPNSWGRWKTCSVEIWSQLRSMTHCDYDACVWLTFPFLVINLITKGSCYLYSLSSSWMHECMRMRKIWGKPPTKCLCHCELWPPGSYRCPMIGEAEASSYNAISACKCTLEYSSVGVQFDAYDMVWIARNAELARQ